MGIARVRAGRFARRSLLALAVPAALLATGVAGAQAVPHSLVASPDIYKVLAENEQYRVIEVTWQPGQRDEVHSHPASAVYYLMDCTLRGYDGKGKLLGERAVKAGAAIVQAPIAAHMLENAGPQPCKLIMFEPR